MCAKRHTAGQVRVSSWRSFLAPVTAWQGWAGRWEGSASREGAHCRDTSSPTSPAAAPHTHTVHPLWPPQAQCIFEYTTLPRASEPLHMLIMLPGLTITRLHSWSTPDTHQDSACAPSRSPSGTALLYTDPAPSVHASPPRSWWAPLTAICCLPLKTLAGHGSIYLCATALSTLPHNRRAALNYLLRRGTDEWMKVTNDRARRARRINYAENNGFIRTAEDKAGMAGLNQLVRSL